MPVRRGRPRHVTLGVVITDVAGFVAWFAGVHKRTLRDVRLLPSKAETWVPSTGDGEAAWGIPQIVRHTAEARLYFASAFAGDGWVWDPWPDEVAGPATWQAALEGSIERFRERVGAVPDDRLREKVELIGGGDIKISGWRVLMMMAEHEVHHRAQISAYAGLNGWPVAQTFDKTNEWVVAQRDAQLRKRGS